MAQPKKTGLGKGLDALFGGVSINEQPQETVVEEKSEINDNLKSLKITEVEPNRDQPRKQFKQEALEDLGAIQAILRKAEKKDGPVITESGNVILDTKFVEIYDGLEEDIKSIVGVIESGLFMDYNVEIIKPDERN